MWLSSLRFPCNRLSCPQRPSTRITVTNAQSASRRAVDSGSAPLSRRRGDEMEVDEETRAKRVSEKQAAKDAGLVKRKLGLHLGYVGTEYSGLQLSHLEHVKTIEGVLRTALCRSGYVSESNSEALFKVVALRCLVDEKKFDVDPEGLEIAEKISAHLPPEIRVFSAQRVNDGFVARKICMSRTYDYYVPMSLLTGSQDGVNERECLERFRMALGEFCGRHAFHNYTRRKQYVDNNDPWSLGRKNRQKRRHAKEEEEESEEEVTPAEALLEKERETGRWRFWSFEFKESIDPSDRIVAPHYRNIVSFTAEDPVPVTPGGVRAVCCKVKGHSFMLHQIRYMIGTAVAVARKLISISVLEASLKACIRINLPLALPQPLILVDSEFSDFPSNRGEPPVVSKWSGNRLEMRAGAAQLQQRFYEETVLAEINQLLTLPEWESWSENLKLVTYDESRQEDVRAVMEKYNAWVKEKQDNKEAKRVALEKELADRGIDHATWMQERRERTQENRKSRTKRH